MIFSFEAAMCQVNDLMHRYKDLKISSYDDNQIIVQGIINVNRKCNDYTLYHNYHLKVIVPINSDELPHAIEVGNQINNNYVHRYPDGELCLDTDTAIRIRFVNGFSLCDWMYEYVETYFFSYEYYQRYGIFPFGERAHGLMGILQTYEEILKLSDYTSAIRFMYSISKEKYRGHLLCPCGSGIILRKCHGETVYKYYADERLNKIVRACSHKGNVRIFEHNFNADKAKIRRQADACQGFLTLNALKFAKKTCVYVYVNTL